jgi:hypothetical protein
MKWFKHLVNSTSDPDLMEAELKFKANGTYVFWRLLEILSREDALDKPLIINFTVFRNWFPSISKQNLIKILSFFDQKSRITYSLLGENISVYCNKLSIISSEYTNKVRRVSGECPESVRKISAQNKIKEEDKDKEKEYIYMLYPPRDENNNNRSTGKCAKDKDRIAKILKSKTKEEIEIVIKSYLDDCSETKTYLMNFGTFLNNLPEPVKKAEVIKDKYDGRIPGLTFWTPS